MQGGDHTGVWVLGMLLILHDDAITAGILPKPRHLPVTHAKNFVHGEIPTESAVRDGMARGGLVVRGHTIQGYKGLAII